MQRSAFLSVIVFLLVESASNCVVAQDAHIRIVPGQSAKKMVITADGKPFAEFFYPDSFPKPILFPIYASDGQIVTRGFPLAQRVGEPEDHPHHTGLWFNYEHVNGIDFWNNSYAIPLEKKHLYGRIQVTTVTKDNPSNNVLSYEADWIDSATNVLLRERTIYRFAERGNERIIDRITTLTAATAVSMEDNKDGLLGLRVAHALELPSAQPKTFTDTKGNISSVTPDSAVTGNYITSAGKTGDSAWGTRAVWCMIYGKMNADTISIAIIDHPGNPGYPTYWHARGYGLFAANPLGQKIFSNGKEALHFRLKKGESAVFKYRLVIASGNQRLSAERLKLLTAEWAHPRQHA